MPLFLKNIVNFVFFTSKMECERGKQYFNNKVVVLNATSVHISKYKYKNARKTSLKKYYTIGLFQFLQRQFCEENRCYVLFENQNYL